MVDEIKVLFLAAEAEPFIKIGGLADVAGTLPLALRNIHEIKEKKISIDVRLVLPFHPSIKEQTLPVNLAAEFSLYRSAGDIPVQVYTMVFKGMPVYFISGNPVSNSPSVYSPDMALDRQKYAFFSLAAFELSRHIGWHPDIIHANDWHTALTLYALRSLKNDSALGNARTVITVHNLPFMGGDGSDVLSDYGLQPLHDDLLPGWAQTQPLPLGLHSSDVIVPVSSTYSREIQTPLFGCGLDPYLKTRAASLVGILNGLDLKIWDPGTDETLPSTFGTEDLSPRNFNKKTLQKHFGLEENAQIPLFVMVGRIDRQKGLDIAFESLRRMADGNWQLLLLGSGDSILENAALSLQADFPDRVRLVFRFDTRLSRLLYGGGDLLLMPSRYEPCGLAQMIAMRYGCIPVVHATGGLKDTVREGETGFLFQDPEPGSMVQALVRALTVFSDTQAWQVLQRNAMQEDFSWSHSAQQYAGIYFSLLSAS